MPSKGMKNSTKILVSGIFIIAAVLGAGHMFDTIGMAFGPTEMGLSGLAGLVGASQLFSGT